MSPARWCLAFALTAAWSVERGPTAGPLAACRLGADGGRRHHRGGGARLRRLGDRPVHADRHCAAARPGNGPGGARRWSCRWWSPSCRPGSGAAGPTESTGPTGCCWPARSRSRANFLGNLDAGNLRMRAGTPFASIGKFLGRARRPRAADPRADPPGRRPGPGDHRHDLHLLQLRRPLAARLPAALRLRDPALLHLSHIPTTGILGPTTAVSSTYIILFITFAAFLQASRVGDYFVNFAFAAAGRARGGPGQGGGVRLRADGHDQRHVGRQRGGHRLADHPPDEEGRLSAPVGRRDRGGGIDRRPDHAADHGRRRLHHGRDHRHPLHRDRHRRDHPGRPLFRLDLLHGRPGGDQDGHARHARGRAAQIRQADPPGLPVSSRSSS